MVGANVVREFWIKNTRIRIADNFCHKTPCEVEQILQDTAERMQKQIIAAAATGKYEQKEAAGISVKCR